MLGSALIFSLVVGAATYAPASGLENTQVVEGKKTEACYKLAPKATFTVTGKAKATLQLWIDLPAKPKKPKAVNVEVSLDGKKTKNKIKPKRGKKNRYKTGGKLTPAKVSMVKINVPEGEHELQIELPKNRSGCIAFQGLKLAVEPEAAPEIAAAAEPELAAPAAEPEAAPELAALAEPELTAVAEPELAAPELAAVAEPDESTMHEIRAEGLADLPLEVEEAVAVSEQSPSGKSYMGLGLELGMVVPRGALNLAPTLALRFEMDLTSLVPGRIDVAGLPTQLGAFASAGWVHLAYQDNETMMPGRGQGQLIQNSMVFPLDMGVSVRVFPVADIGVVAALGFAADISRTKIDAFSLETESQNDFSMGYSLSVGATMKVPTGLVFAQIRQREIGADLNQWQDVAEPSMASTGFSLAYIFSFAE